MSCKSDEHDWDLLYETKHIRTYVCKRCGKNSYQEKSHAE